MKKMLIAMVMMSLLGGVQILSAADIVTWNSIAVDTNAAAATTNVPSRAHGDVEIAGWADTLIVDLGGTASQTCTVYVVTLAGGTLGQSRTIFSKTLAADAVFPLRDVACTQTGADTTNTPARVPLWGKLRCLAYAGSSTGMTARLDLVTSDRP